MEWALASVAVALLAYAAVSGRITGTSLTAPMVFTAFGLLVGSETLGFIDLSPLGGSVQELAEATLAVVLFADASRIDLRALRGELAIPARLLGVGLPLTLIAGFVVALALLGGLAWPEALLLAVILAPTDAALGQAVVTLPRLPVRVRQSLNVESGLNDGICVPVFLIVLAIATAEGGAIGDGAAARLVAEQIGYGALAGGIAGAAAAAAILVAERATHTEQAWLQIVPLAAAGLAWGIATPIGGSGFIGAFVGGVAFRALRRDTRRATSPTSSTRPAPCSGPSPSSSSVPFCSARRWTHLTVSIVLYALLSLTVIRMAPVVLALVGTGMRPQTTRFLGWFGPRGLASIVFALMLEEDGGVPHAETITVTAFVTVGLSVLLHGLTAAPLAERYARWFESHPKGGAPVVESSPATDVRWRHPAGGARA